ncbi:MAG TPA: tetratricopeptide repeat protein [bacterium]|nr:tetratricopeptide repeat protein [bacterium]
MSIASRLPLFLTLATFGLFATAASAPETFPANAHILDMKSMEARPESSRLVIFLDQSVEFLVVELPDRPGVEVHLLGTSTSSLPAALAVNDGRIAKAELRASTRGAVLRIEGAGPKLRCSSFSLQDPARIVIDFDPDAPPAPTPSPVPASTTFDSPADSTNENEPSFEDFLSWLNEFREHAEALHEEISDEDRGEHLRAISSLLASRGLFTEAERALSHALQLKPDDSEAFADSLRLAELRVVSGHPQEALSIVQRLSFFGKTTEDRVRVAEVHANAGAPFVALGILEDVLPQLSAEKVAEAKMLRARCLWDCGAVEKSLRAIDDLLLADPLPKSIEESTHLLRADCLFTLGRFGEARRQYEEAADSHLDPEEAAWTQLQLGNLAHREGHVEAARQHYREASQSYPQTFYAAQAAWFLQTSQRLEDLTAKKEAFHGG